MTERRQDIILGGVFAATGLSAAYIAAGYRGASGIYPMSLGYVIAILGAIVAIKAMLRGSSEPREIIRNAPQAFLTVGIGAIYLALVPILGFYIASALLVLALPAALGFRRLLFTFVTAAIFVGIVWVIFSVILEKPLPMPVWISY